MRQVRQAPSPGSTFPLSLIVEHKRSWRQGGGRGQRSSKMKLSSVNLPCFIHILGQIGRKWRWEEFGETTGGTVPCFQGGLGALGVKGCLPGVCRVDRPWSHLVMPVDIFISYLSPSLSMCSREAASFGEYTLARALVLWATLWPGEDEGPPPWCPPAVSPGAAWLLPWGQGETGYCWRNQ